MQEKFPNSTRGICCMIIGSALLTLNDAITKWLTQDYPVSQVWGLRTLFVVVLLTLVAPRYGGYRALLPNRVKPQILRAILFFLTTFLIVTGLSLLPLAQMVAIVFSSPIFAEDYSPVRGNLPLTIDKVIFARHRPWISRI